MELITELNKASALGIEGFQAFISQQQEVNKDYLEQSFWMPNGMQLTVLSYLIQQHCEYHTGVATNPVFSDLRPFIHFVVQRTRDKNAGEPVHQAILAGALNLAIYLLGLAVFDVNRRDKNGSTLLSLVLTTKNKRLLQALLANKPNIHESSRLTEEGIECQPLHQAVMFNFGFGVQALIKAGAQLNNPVGPWRDTPLVFAARLGKIKALAALLDAADKQDLEVENHDRTDPDGHGYTAIEALCHRLEHDQQDKSLIHGIAMLLCRGAEPPRSDSMRQLLACKRMELLKAIDGYLDKYPDLVDAFVTRCHLIDKPLHSIIYVDHSWGHVLRQLFGRPSTVGFMVEHWVTRKYGSLAENRLGNSELPTKADAADTGNEDPVKLYAEFVRRYTLAYNRQRITNPWSTMNWMIAEGQCDWPAVLRYSREHPTSRTRLVVNDMIEAKPSIKNLHEEQETSVISPLANNF